MAKKGNLGENITQGSVSMLIVVDLSCFFYILEAWQKGGSGKGDGIALEITKNAGDCIVFANLEFENLCGEESGNFGGLKFEV